MNQNNDISRTAVVTGASKGIGRAIAIALSRKGWRVALLARNEAGLADTQSRLQPTAQGHILLPCDISMWNECQRATDRFAEELGHLDLLVNNAFGSGEAPLAEMDPGQIHDFFATSAAGTAMITKAMLPLLEKGSLESKRKAQIVNIVADWGFPMHNITTGPSIYVAGKYAVHGFGAALHREVAPRGINVTNIYPGVVASDLDIDDPASLLRERRGNTAISLADLTHVLCSLLDLSSCVVRHVVISPDNPEYNGL